VQVTEQAEARDVGQRVGAGGARLLGRAFVEPGHHADRPLDQRVVREPALDRRGHGAGAERLGQHQHVALAPPGVREDRAGIHDAGDRHPVLGLGVVDRVPADQRRPRGRGRVGAAAQDLGQHLTAQRLQREGHEVQGRHGARAHRVDVRERVRGRDAPEPVRVVDDRREEVDRLHDRQLVREGDHARVVGGVGRHEHPRVGGPGDARDDRPQRRGGQLAPTARAVGEGGQGDGHRRL
jgi:hypothetical protein